MDKLQWFKFTPSDWMMGKIQRCPEITQARFIRLCCLYWNKETNLLLEDAIIEIDQEHFDILISKRIITDDGTHIQINFLDEQMDLILETSRKCSKAGKISAEKRRLKKQPTFNDGSTPVQRNPTDKIREEKIREELMSKILVDSANRRFLLERKKFTKKEIITECELFLELNYPTGGDFNDINKHFYSYMKKREPQIDDSKIVPDTYPVN